MAQSAKRQKHLKSATFDFAAHATRQAKWKYYEQRFVLHRQQLNQFASSTTLNWQSLMFVKTNITKVSAKPGVYAFSVRHDDSNLPPHNYVLYVGQAGFKKHGTRTLRSRIKEYFREESGKGRRAHVREFLNKWKGVIVFHFAEVDRTVNLKKLEAKLNDALLPPYSVGDFSANIRSSKRLWSLT